MRSPCGSDPEAGAAGDAGRSASRLKRLAALLLLLAGVVVLLEFGLRLAHDGGQIDPAMFAVAAEHPGYALRPNWEGRLRFGGRTTRIMVDAYGRRWTPGAVMDAVPHIHLVGDSQVFGWGLGQAETIAARLQAQLGSTARVFSHGVPGWGPIAYTSVLAQLPEQDLVVVVHSAQNDLTDVFDPRWRYEVRCGRLAGAGWLGRVIPCPLQELLLVQLLVAGQRHIIAPHKAVPLQFDPYASVAARVLHSRLMRLYEDASRRFGARLIFTYVPWDARLDPARLASFYPPLASAVSTVSWPDDCGVVAHLRATAAPFLPNDGHLSAAGADALAQCLGDVIRQRLQFGG